MTKTLDVVTERDSAIAEYRTIMADMVGEILHEYRQSTLPMFRIDREYAQDSAGWFTALKGAAINATEKATRKASELFNREGKSFTNRFKKTVYKATGASVSSFAFGDHSALLLTHAERNASLIKSVSDDVVKRIEQAVYDTKLNKQGVRHLQARLRKDMGVVDRRIEGIAKDQLASLNTDLARAHHAAAGVKKYEWVTRRDSRVRSRHARLHGRTFRWDRPTPAENGLHAGKPINCRCVPKAIIPKRGLFGEVIQAIGIGVAIGAAIGTANAEDE